MTERSDMWRKYESGRAIQLCTSVLISRARLKGSLYIYVDNCSCNLYMKFTFDLRVSCSQPWSDDHVCGENIKIGMGFGFVDLT